MVFCLETTSDSEARVEHESSAARSFLAGVLFARAAAPRSRRSTSARTCASVGEQPSLSVSSRLTLRRSASFFHSTEPTGGGGGGCVWPFFLDWPSFCLAACSASRF